MECGKESLARVDGCVRDDKGGHGNVVGAVLGAKMRVVRVDGGYPDFGDAVR